MCENRNYNSLNVETKTKCVECIAVNNRFSGKYAFLSNYYKCQIIYNNLKFYSSEAAFQATKCMHYNDRIAISKMKNPHNAKKFGQTVQMKSDWSEVKKRAMLDILICKFEQNPTLKKQLLQTESMCLIEENTWFDYYWGTTGAVGFNYLGRILMYIRAKIIQSRQEKTIKTIV